jgi:hypothetical protein
MTFPSFCMREGRKTVEHSKRNRDTEKERRQIKEQRKKINERKENELGVNIEEEKIGTKK